MRFTSEDDPKCPKCAKAVFMAEARGAGKYKWHKNCFFCQVCHKTLDSLNCCEHDKELYCRVCHARRYGMKGYGFAGLAAETLDSIYLDALVDETPSKPTTPKILRKAKEGEGCPRCGIHVYAAEQMLARGKGYHRRCFKCLNCNRTLDSTTHCDGPDKEIYCRGCYAQKFGARGYGHIGVSSLGLMSDIKDKDWQSELAPKTAEVDPSKIQAKDGSGCPRCGGVVFAAELVISKGRGWHRKCYKCNDCTKTLDSIIACDGPDRDVYCKTCYGKRWGPHGYGFANGYGFLQTDISEEDLASSRPFANIDTTIIKAPQGEGCPRCGGMVFAAEQQLARGTMWHKKCYNCFECHRPLDSMLSCDGPDKEIHCRACYGKLFGPKGFGYGHTPTLVSTTGEAPVIAPDAVPKTGPKKVENGNGCPRCGYPVYAAELMISKNRVWHKRCFSCIDCGKHLDSMNLNDGPNLEIYCRGCYNRNYGIKGFGFGMGAGTLTAMV
ncbi:muscle LIM protein Mlp84B-like [Phlebotomus argentipes]|uniref:muscle LIM protein Mlp84B-like n=1 Tax=Phlebotomus argentipes TaxID=94469 RepID=UPI0028929F12|nr:muscle LIM protein Mlp84B-like [Phlebotomus argentipes]